MRPLGRAEQIYSLLTYIKNIIFDRHLYLFLYYFLHLFLSLSLSLSLSLLKNNIIIKNELPGTIGDTHKILLDDYAVHLNFLYTHTRYR